MMNARGWVTLFLAAVSPMMLAVQANAQPFPGAEHIGPPPLGPDIRARIERLRVAARNDAVAALTSDHRAALVVIVDHVKAHVLEPRLAATQLDALLDESEREGVVEAAQRARVAMRAAMGMPPNGAAPGPAPDHHETPDRFRGYGLTSPDSGALEGHAPDLRPDGHERPARIDPGRYLIFVSIDLGHGRARPPVPPGSAPPGVP
jgi:hypothetical protein